VADPSEMGSLPELARRSYQLFSAEGIDVWMERFTTPDFVWDVEPLGLGVYEGRAAYREFYLDWVSSYESWSIQLEEVHQVGPDFTVATVVQHGRPHGSDQSVEFRWVQLSIWEGSRISRAINYSDVEDATEAASRRSS
jgi:hypothetical protein